MHLIPKLLIGFAMAATTSNLFGKDIKHYVYFELERERISEPSFINTKNLVGAQLKYT